MSTLHSITEWTRAAILLIASTGFGGDAYSSPIPMPTTEQLLQVVVAHYRAIEDNQLDEAMRHYHSQSPEIARARENIEFDLSQYLLKTTTLTFCYAVQEGEIAVAIAKHRYLMITGIKFIEHFVDAVYELREEEGHWKIWTQRDSLNDNVRLLKCEN